MDTGRVSTVEVGYVSPSLVLGDRGIRGHPSRARICSRSALGSAASDRNAQREEARDVLVDGAARDEGVGRVSVEVEGVSEKIHAADHLEYRRQAITDRC